MPAGAFAYADPIVTPTATPEEHSGRAARPGGDARHDRGRRRRRRRRHLQEGDDAEESRRGIAHVRAGDVVKFRLRVTNLGTEVAEDVLVCDIVPRGLTLVRSSREGDLPARVACA